MSQEKSAFDSAKKGSECSECCWGRAARDQSWVEQDCAGICLYLLVSLGRFGQKERCLRTDALSPKPALPCGNCGLKKAKEDTSFSHCGLSEGVLGQAKKGSAPSPKLGASRITLNLFVGPGSLIGQTDDQTNKHILQLDIPEEEKLKNLRHASSLDASCLPEWHTKWCLLETEPFECGPWLLKDAGGRAMLLAISRSLLWSSEFAWRSYGPLPSKDALDADTGTVLSEPLGLVIVCHGLLVNVGLDFEGFLGNGNALGGPGEHGPFG